MKTRTHAVLLATLVALAPADARAQSIFSVFGGYAIVRAPAKFHEVLLCPVVAGGQCPSRDVSTRANLRGWDVSARHAIHGRLGIVANVSGAYGTAEGARVHLYTYMAGPGFSTAGRVAVSARVLVGGGHESFGRAIVSGYASTPVQHDGLVAAAGSAIDATLTPRVALRVLQADLLYTNFQSHAEGQIRLAAGVLLRW